LGDTLPIIRSSKTVIAASGFTCVFGCQLLCWLSQRSGQQPKIHVKPEAAITVFELLMMGGVSPEICWAIKKQWNNKFYAVASCWFFLWDLQFPTLSSVFIQLIINLKIFSKILEQIHCKISSRTIFTNLHNRLSWHYHVDQMIPKLNKASYIIRSLKPLLSFKSLKMVYFSTVHSIISYGIIFWGISSHSK
jgi:hypothetical protein